MDPIARVRTQYRALETGDPELAAAAVSADWADEEAGAEQVLAGLRGPASLLATGAWMRHAVTGLRFAEEAIVGDDRTVISYVRFTGRHTGPFVVFRGGKVAHVIPPTGNELDVRQTHINEVRDGEIVRHVAVRDDRAMLARLEVLPPTPRAVARTVRWIATGRSRRAGQQVLAEMRAAAASGQRV